MALEILVVSILSILLSAAMSLIFIGILIQSMKDKKRENMNPKECLANLKRIGTRSDENWRFE